MRVLFITPAPPRSRKGNRVTALRWAALVRELGHRAALATQFTGQKCDLLVALHARKSHASLARYRRQRPAAPAILALTGTDLYGDIRTSVKARQSLEWADRIVLLQPLGMDELPASLRPKTRVIYQSQPAIAHRPPVQREGFDVCVMGHLRPVKDPFRTAMAARRLPSSSRIRVVHLGSALTPDMAQRARAEMDRNPRYRWRGDVPRGRALRQLARSRLLALTSKLEGGANVISEAVAAGTPVVSSRISGSVGLLGDDYPGYFPVGDTQALAELLHRAETDAAFYNTLIQRCAALQPLFDPERERESWRQLLAELHGN